MSKQTGNKFSPEVRSRAVRLVLDQEAEHRSRWTAIMSIAAKIGCTPQTLLDRRGSPRWSLAELAIAGWRSAIPSLSPGRRIAPDQPCAASAGA